MEEFRVNPAPVRRVTAFFSHLQSHQSCTVCVLVLGERVRTHMRWCAGPGMRLRGTPPRQTLGALPCPRNWAQVPLSLHPSLAIGILSVSREIRIPSQKASPLWTLTGTSGACECRDATIPAVSTHVLSGSQRDERVPTFVDGKDPKGRVSTMYQASSEERLAAEARESDQ